MSGDLPNFKKFVSESELEEAKKKRQEDWERVRKPEQPLEAPEEPYDHRCLFERLEEQRVKKQEEWDESHRLKNMVRGLENDEVEFLDFVSRRQEQMEEAKQVEEQLLLAEYKNATVPVFSPVISSSSSKASLSKAVPPQVKSQKALLAGVVKRKSSDSSCKPEEEKKAKLEDGGVPTSAPGSVNGQHPAQSAGGGLAPHITPQCSTASTNDSVSSALSFATATSGSQPPSNGGDANDALGGAAGRVTVLANTFCSVVAVLPGIGDYKDSSDGGESTDTSTSSDGELEDLLYPSKPKVVVKQSGGNGNEEQG